MHYNGSLVRGDHSDLLQIPGLVWTDEHHKPLLDVLGPDRIVEGIEDDVVADAVPASTGSDDRYLHRIQVSLRLGRMQGNLVRP